MKVIRLLLFPFAIPYGIIVFVRNFLYDRNFFKSSRFNLPIICIGNLSMGGTGKTPHTEYLIRLLKDNYKLATLSRGFGRRERDFRIADETATVQNLGDEPLQYYRKFKNQITVAVEANRVHGVMDLCREKPETEVILLDDGFQHRPIAAGFNIVLTTYDLPFYEDYILPIGSLREFESGKKRADLIIVTKCPAFETIDKTAIISKLKLNPSQHVFFSRISYGELYPLNDNDRDLLQHKKQIILVTGIANAEILVKHLSASYKILHHFNFRDHHAFSTQDIREIHNLIDKFVLAETCIVTTEKDAMRLMNAEFTELLKAYPWFVQSIEIELDRPELFDPLIQEYVKKNS